MKKLLLFFLIAGLIAGCASKAIEGSRVITGEIQVVGNEPFAKLAVRNNDGIFFLDCSGRTKDFAYKNQGRVGRIYYSSLTTGAESVKVLKVEKIEIIQR